MGSMQSSRTRMEAMPAASKAVGDSPKLRRNESFEEKFLRKFTAEPLVPVGCLVTAYFLGSGIGSFYKRDAARSQKMMRLRVGAQFATLMVFMGYYGLSNFDFKLAPMHQAALEAKKHDEDETK
mmetsp:Transcript_11058/g.18345  ORF Transcript_11058/g.18345 Transcript_11058/m.18345 type:complete len:124 (-) Transcript_11058:163-534(-)|eukprot:CAMPEP_0119005680 /NCGR_PEP_ID=MMETSP1176-20130426/1864_1 /TAXON_ID=265551 /ORGANISM="Synedropsis recta cf, Strain CCMP1620" /LENGTH=123 /DNA_ID=CAMNT_0006957517 /DNA_START=59 /DNA_END=430 /DNA_ORIENTATION=+